MNYTKEQLERLPKWAQNEIKRLEANASYWEKQVDEMYQSDEGTNTAVIGIKNNNLPNNSVVRFAIGNGVSIRAYIKGDSLNIWSNKSMSISPDASNSVTIK